MTVILLAQIQSECQDQAQQNFEPDLDLNCLLMLSTEECDQQKYVNMSSLISIQTIYKGYQQTT